MYLTRTRPMTRESMADTTRTSVAVKAVWRCEGRNSEIARRQRGAFEVETMKNGLILPFGVSSLCWCGQGETFRKGVGWKISD